MKLQNIVNDTRLKRLENAKKVNLPYTYFSVIDNQLQDYCALDFHKIKFPAPIIDGNSSLEH